MNCVIREFLETAVKQTKRLHKANPKFDQDVLNEYCAEQFSDMIIKRCVELCNEGDVISDYFGLNLNFNVSKREAPLDKSEQVSKLTHALSLMNEALYYCDSKYANDLENLTEDLDYISNSIEFDLLDEIDEIV